jgi:hypothetical protein
MKRLLSISKGKGKPLKQAAIDNQQSLLNTTVHNIRPSLPPKYLATAVPHPLPFERLLVLASAEGLLFRPDIPQYETVVKICWGKNAKVEEVDVKSVAGIPDWSSAAVAYGIVGIVRLFVGK